MNELNNKLDGLIDKYREDITPAAQGINSDSEKYKETSINVAALASINLKSDLEALITEQVRLGELYGRLHQTIELFQSGAISADTYSKLHADLTDKIAQIKEENL